MAFHDLIDKLDERLSVNKDEVNNLKDSKHTTEEITATLSSDLGKDIGDQLVSLVEKQGDMSIKQIAESSKEIERIQELTNNNQKLLGSDYDVLQGILKQSKESTEFSKNKFAQIGDSIISMVKEHSIDVTAVAAGVFDDSPLAMASILWIGQKFKDSRAKRKEEKKLAEEEKRQIELKEAQAEEERAILKKETGLTDEELNAVIEKKRQDDLQLERQKKIDELHEKYGTVNLERVEESAGEIDAPQNNTEQTLDTISSEITGVRTILSDDYDINQDSIAEETELRRENERDEEESQNLLERIAEGVEGIEFEREEEESNWFSWLLLSAGGLAAAFTGLGDGLLQFKNNVSGLRDKFRNLGTTLKESKIGKSIINFKDSLMNSKFGRGVSEAATKVKNWTGDKVTTIKDGVKNAFSDPGKLKTNITQKATGIKDAVKSNLSQFDDSKFVTRVKELYTKLDSSFSKITSSFDDSKLVSQAKQLKSSIGSKFTQISSSFDDWKMADNLDDVKRLFSAEGKIGAAINGIRNTFKDFSVVDKFDDIKSLFSSGGKFGEAISGIKNTFGSVGNFFSNMWSSMNGFVTTLIQKGGTIGKFVGATKSVFTFIGNWLAPITALAAFIWGFWKSEGDIGDRVKAGLLNVWDVMVVSLVDSVKGIVTWVLEFFGLDNLSKAIGDATSDILGGLTKAVGGIIDVVIGIFTLDPKLLTKGLSAVAGGIWDTVVGVFGGIVNIFEGVLLDVADLIEGVITYPFELVKTILIGTLDFLGFDGLSNLVEDVFDNIISSVSGIFDGIEDIIKGIFTLDIGKFIAGLGKFALGIGEFIVGLVASALDYVWDSIRGILSFVGIELPEISLKDLVTETFDKLANIMTQIGEWVSEKVAWAMCAINPLCDQDDRLAEKAAEKVNKETEKHAKKQSELYKKQKLITEESKSADEDLKESQQSLDAARSGNRTITINGEQLSQEETIKYYEDQVDAAQIVVDAKKQEFDDVTTQLVENDRVFDNKKKEIYTDLGMEEDGSGIAKSDDEIVSGLEDDKGWVDVGFGTGTIEDKDAIKNEASAKEIRALLNAEEWNEEDTKFLQDTLAEKEKTKSEARTTTPPKSKDITTTPSKSDDEIVSGLEDDKGWVDVGFGTGTIEDKDAIKNEASAKEIRALLNAEEWNEEDTKFLQDTLAEKEKTKSEARTTSSSWDKVVSNALEGDLAQEDWTEADEKKYASTRKRQQEINTGIQALDDNYGVTDEYKDWEEWGWSQGESRPQRYNDRIANMAYEGLSDQKGAIDRSEKEQFEAYQNYLHSVSKDDARTSKGDMKRSHGNIKDALRRSGKTELTRKELKAYEQNLKLEAGGEAWRSADELFITDDTQEARTTSPSKSGARTTSPSKSGARTTSPSWDKVVGNILGTNSESDLAQEDWTEADEKKYASTRKRQQEINTGIQALDDNYGVTDEYKDWDEWGRWQGETEPQRYNDRIANMAYEGLSDQKGAIDRSEKEQFENYQNYLHSVSKDDARTSQGARERRQGNIKDALDRSGKTEMSNDEFKAYKQNLKLEAGGEAWGSPDELFSIQKAMSGETHSIDRLTQESPSIKLNKEKKSLPSLSTLDDDTLERLETPPVETATTAAEAMVESWEPGHSLGVNVHNMDELIKGLDWGEYQDGGDGSMRRVSATGEVQTQDGSGQTTVDKDGNLMRYVTPNVGGVQNIEYGNGDTSTIYENEGLKTRTDMINGEEKTSSVYTMGDVSIAKDIHGKTSASYKMGNYQADIKDGSDPTSIDWGYWTGSDNNGNTLNNIQQQDVPPELVANVVKMFSGEMTQDERLVEKDMISNPELTTGKKDILARYDDMISNYGRMADMISNPEPTTGELMSSVSHEVSDIKNEKESGALAAVVSANNNSQTVINNNNTNQTIVQPIRNSNPSNQYNQQRQNGWSAWN